MNDNNKEHYNGDIEPVKENYDGYIKLIKEDEDYLETNTFEQPKEGLIEKLKGKKGIWGILGALLFILVKFKVLFFLILTKLKFLLVFLKLTKFASTAISMVVMIWVYASMYGLKFAVGFVLLLFAHEMGHYLVARKMDMNVSLPLFIPFVGALISLKEAPKDAVTEAKMAIGGPIVGSLAALFCYVLYIITGDHFLIALAYTGFFLNIFNLIPIHPLDGGRTVSAISPKIWLIGLVLGIVAIIKFFNPILLLILVLGVIQMITHWKNPNLEYYSVDSKTRFLFAVLYFGLLFLLGIAMAYTHDIAILIVR
ncbi:MAG: site-2 protease family protein [Clostridiaceae bacterium]